MWRCFDSFLLFYVHLISFFWKIDVPIVLDSALTVIAIVIVIGIGIVIVIVIVNIIVIVIIIIVVVVIILWLLCCW